MFWHQMMSSFSPATLGLEVSLDLCWVTQKICASPFLCEGSLPITPIKTCTLRMYRVQNQSSRRFTWQKKKKKAIYYRDIWCYKWLRPSEKKIKETLGKREMMPFPKCKTFSHIKSLSSVKWFTTYKILPHTFFSLNSHNNFVTCCDTALQIWKLTLREINQDAPWSQN